MRSNFSRFILCLLRWLKLLKKQTSWKYKSLQKQTSRGVLRKRCSGNIQQIYWRTPMPKCDFNKVAKHGCSAVNLLQISRAHFPKNTHIALSQFYVDWIRFGILISYATIYITNNVCCDVKTFRNNIFRIHSKRFTVLSQTK